MSIEKKDISNMTSEELLEEIKKNNNQTKRVRREISSIRSFLDNQTVAISTQKLDEPFNYEEEPTLEEEEFEEDYYLDFVDKYMGLNEGFTEEDLLSVLPSPDDYDYKDIIYRLIAESQKEINEMLRMKLGDDSLNEEEKKECDKTINHEKNKIKILKDKLTKKEELEPEEKEDNILVFMKSSAGNIKILDDIDQIEPDTYSVFLDLIKSIENGTFKGFKRLQGKHVAGLLEVKDYQARITYKRLKDNIYVVIQAFTKKVTTGQKYRTSMVGRYHEFLAKESSILKDIENPDFIEENNTIKDELYDKLSRSKDAYRKGTK